MELKGKKQKTQEEKYQKQPEVVEAKEKVEKRKLSQDLIDQLLGSGDRARREVQLNPCMNKFEDKY